ncbi:MAG: hypothetical protein EXQ51_02050 [Acidobacteria bacterium]|nr:hypothetical protein [Acidobacteriota bacterium]
MIACDERLQSLGYLAWAACGKDPGFSPLGVIDHARRSSHYSSDEIASLAFEGPPPNPAGLSRRWSATLETALSLIAKLPAERAGEAVFHAGRLGGALPQITG